LFKAKINFDYTAAADDELTLKKDEVIYVLSLLDNEGWWEGQYESAFTKGTFPSNFVEEIPDSKPDSESAAASVQVEAAAPAQPAIKLPPGAIQMMGGFKLPTGGVPPLKNRVRCPSMDCFLRKNLCCQGPMTGAAAAPAVAQAAPEKPAVKKFKQVEKPVESNAEEVAPEKPAESLFGAKKFNKVFFSSSKKRQTLTNPIELAHPCLGHPARRGCRSCARGSGEACCHPCRGAGQSFWRPQV